MLYKITNYEDGILFKGNNARLKSLMKRAEKGGSFTIGFIGGSITQGSVATRDELCYAYRVFEWWVNTFPNAKFRYVNAGIGATDSQFACARVEDDLLSYNPDFVITEFSVNDEDNEHYLETYEGLLRRVYGHDSGPAVVTMNNVFYESGRNAEAQHVRLAKYYDIPSLGVRPTVYKAVADGNINARDITPDDLHPNDEGHALVAGQITYFLTQIHKECAVEEKEVMLTDSITRNSYEKSKRLYNKNCSPKSEGFEPDLSVQQGVRDCFKNGWTASNTGDRISFDIKGTNISVQFKKSYKHPAPVARLTLDGNTEDAIVLDANFDETWGDKLFLTTVSEGLPDVEHHVEIELIETHSDDTAPFYLAALLVSGEDY